MEKKDKYVFIANDYNEIEALSKLLKEKGISNKLDWFIGKRLIQTPKEKYLECLEVGTVLVKDKGFKTIEWVNAYGEQRPFGYLSLMYCCLPERRSGNKLWEIIDSEEYGLDREYCPIDIKTYFHEFKVLFGRNIVIKYNSTDNAFEVIIEADLSDYEQLIEKCQVLNTNLKKSPFKTIFYCEKDGTLIQTEEKKKKDKDGINSYFYQSMFFEGLAYPQGSNISPKTDNSTDIEVTGFKASRTGSELRNFIITSEIDNGTYKQLIGDYIADIEKEYNYYWNANTHEQTTMRKPEQFTMIDNGNFNSQITVESPTDVSITTTISIVRNVVGYNYDGMTIRDGYYGNEDHNDTKFGIQIKEYFKMIKPNRLLHYSDNSDSVELFDLPDGWVVTDGLDGIDNPKVYGNMNIDSLDQDEDYGTIKRLLDERQPDDIGQQRVLKPNNKK